MQGQRMRLKKSRTAAEEELAALQNEGHQVLDHIRQDYERKRRSGEFQATRDVGVYRQAVSQWIQRAVIGLLEIFPTELEANTFRNASNTNTTYAHGENADYGGLRNRVLDLIGALDHIVTTKLERYTDLPIKDRLYIEDIDSFRKVRDVNPHMVAHFLDNGYLQILEDNVQRYLEDILGVSFHQKDWPGEINDLYATTLLVNSQRVATAFLLKGRGLQRHELRIADCGKNGDQLVRLFDSPAELFVIQFVGIVDQMVIKDVEGKVAARKAASKPTWFMIVDGQDTARILYAYGKLSSIN